MRREIYYRLAVICFALAVALIVYATGLAAGYPDALLWSAIILVVGLWVFYPREPMDYDWLDHLRTRAHAIPLPYWLLKSRGGQNPASRDARKANRRGSGGGAR